MLQKYETCISILFLISCLFFAFDCIIIDKPECSPRFVCDDNCTVIWMGTCPVECKCIPKECPEIVCPADPPVCIIYTRHDGCQDCACRAPFRFVDLKNRTRPAPRERATTKPTFLPPDRIPTENQNVPLESATLEPPTTVRVVASPGEPPRPPSIISEEFLKCSVDQKREIDRHFGQLNMELADIQQMAGTSMFFPALFALSRHELKTRCEQYKASYTKTSYVAKRNCFSDDYHVYTRTYYAYSYACGWGTEAYFFRYFDCLQSLRFVPQIQTCLSGNLPEQYSNPYELCAKYNDLMNCTHETVVRTCGWDGWEIIYQFLSVNAKSLSRNCRLRRITTVINLDETTPLDMNRRSFV